MSFPNTGYMYLRFGHSFLRNTVGPTPLIYPSAWSEEQLCKVKCFNAITGGEGPRLYSNSVIHCYPLYCIFYIIYFFLSYNHSICPVPLYIYRYFVYHFFLINPTNITLNKVTINIDCMWNNWRHLSSNQKRRRHY